MDRSMFFVHKISDFLFKVRTRKSVVTENHDRIKLCRDETLPSWMTKAEAESVTNNRGETDLCICEQRGGGGGSMIVCGRCTRVFHQKCVDKVSGTEEHAAW